MNITLFGGTFDPPHNAHLTIAHFLIKHQISDQVWFVPVYKHPWAKRYHKTELTPYSHRINMLNLLISSQRSHSEAKSHEAIESQSHIRKSAQSFSTSKDNNLSQANALSIKHFRHTSFTYPTIKYFEDKYPKHQFSWVMGSEYIEKFHLFLKDHPLLANYTFYIYPRQGHPLKNLYTFMTPLKAPLIKVSSSDIRWHLNQGKSISTLVPPQVKAYIKENNLYTSTKTPENN